ncbi:hypothetical protein AFLA_005926 [Aspergillus flavus NRRL3357]|nr:hypothetical protein AFLA_005926 [Aspergillus flavus NRRL3357]
MTALSKVLELFQISIAETFWGASPLTTDLAICPLEALHYTGIFLIQAIGNADHGPLTPTVDQHIAGCVLRVKLYPTNTHTMLLWVVHRELKPSLAKAWDQKAFDEELSRDNKMF